VIDVGTDHGYVSIALALRGNTVFACDAAEAPLSRAIANARRYRISGSIKFIHCDGIPTEIAETIGCVIIAGMGGETILGILDKADGRLRPDVKLILQPQSKKESLRVYLNENGWSTSETRVFEGRREYTILECRKHSVNQAAFSDIK